MYDLIIKQALIYDGTGAEPYVADVAVENDKISKIGALNNGSARKTIDGKGLSLTPGFIDTHASTGFGFFFPHAADHKIYQGITTEIFGNCGTSPAPIGSGLENTMNRLADELGFTFDWHSLEEYFQRLEAIGLQFNVATLTGHSTLRSGVLQDWNNVSEDEQDGMSKLMEQSMQDGSLGLSTGLIYAPGCFADTSEIVHLAGIAAKYGGIYASHMRDERDKLEEAIEETLEIGSKAGIDVLVSHLKSAEMRNYGKIPDVLRRLDAYNAQGGNQAKVDVYPYTAVSTKVRAFIPKHLLDQGIEQLAGRLKSDAVIAEIDRYIIDKDFDLSQMLIISNEEPSWEGKTVRQIANENGWTEGRTLTELLSANTEMWMVYHCIDEKDIDAAVTWHNSMICTDSWSHPINAPNRIGVPHPRSYGAFTQFIVDYVQRKKLITFQEAVRKMTSLPASYFGLEKRGLIEPGYYADLVLFNQEAIKVNATYTNPCELSEGVEHLWINGQHTIEGGAINESTSGRVLRHGR